MKKQHPIQFFGVWSIGDVKEDEPEDLSAEINGKPIYCPICRERMKMWIEGCGLLHFICKKCNFRFTQVKYLNEKDELDLEYYYRLIGVIYNA